MTTAERPSVWRVWLAAIRPATLTAAVGPVVVASAVAAADGGLNVWVALAALLGALFIQVGTNLYNDYADFEKGADTEARLGPARAVQRGWLSGRTVLRGAALSFAMAALVGTYLVYRGGWPLLVLGLLSIASGYLYTGGPKPLAYHGLGDAFVMLFFGLIAVCGTYYAQTLALTPTVVGASIGVGALATAIIVVNNLRDRDTDRAAGKRTLVVRYGERFGRLEFTILLMVAYATPLGLYLANPNRHAHLLPLLTLPFAALLIRRVRRLDGRSLNPMLGATARLGMAFNALFALGVIL